MIKCIKCTKKVQIKTMAHLIKKNCCLLCGEKLPDSSILEFDNLPASAQNIPDKTQLKKEKGIDLKLYQCPSCGLVQFNCQPVSYYKNVIRAGGYSTTMVELRKKQYTHLIEKYSLTNKKFLEVGCGQGEFLAVLNDFDVDAYGIENTPALVEKAREKGLNVYCDFLGSADKKIKNAPFDAFLSFNFLEHQPDPNGMLKGIYNNLVDDGVGLITVPSFEYIVEKNCYYEFIKDHLAYYTFDTFCFALEKNGFEVLEKEIINRDTLAIIVRKRKQLKLNRLAQNKIDLTEQLNEYIDNHLKLNRKVAVWGASHQGFTIIPTTHIENKIDCIIDSAPFKQGKFSPASHVEIISPSIAVQRNLGAIIIVAPGYTDEIANNIRNTFSEDVEIATIKTDKLEIIKPFDKDKR